jgi:hypothetical protein
VIIVTVLAESGGGTGTHSTAKCVVFFYYSCSMVKSTLCIFSSFCCKIFVSNVPLRSGTFSAIFAV